ncbi:MAG: sulfatase-like hydrolase/transferase [Clostridiaceae bacterium]|nr:sulfatase-like hydrolase/transferase [Clostridiaceae bacterium]
MSEQLHHVVLISKDATLPEYLPVYGNEYWKTPNIDELARKGTVFRQHYTAAPSTAMAFTSMFTGLYPYQLDRKDYTEVEEYQQGTTLFDEMYKRGYSCHLMWSNNYIKMAEKYSKCYGAHTTHHESKKLNQSVGVHIPKDESRNNLVRDNAKAEEVMTYLVSELDSIDRSKPVFLWVHLPHVLLGRCGYGQDIDLWDRFVGEVRQRFGDDGIYISADHGNMNGYRGKTTYGFDVYQPAIHIPLIAPRINGLKEITFPTSNAQLMDIILNNEVKQNEFIISDSQYYAQPFRKIAIIRGRYKYMYNKFTKVEELYDIHFDPNENINLLANLLYDEDRDRMVNAEQVIFYPYREEAMENYRIIKEFFNSIWKTADKFTENKNYVERKLKNLKAKIKRNL